MARTVEVRYKASGAQDVVAANKQIAASFSEVTKADFKTPQAAFEGLANKTALGGVAIAAGIGLAVKSFADFDKQMSAASAATQASGEQLNALREAAVNAGRDTQFTATEAASAITSMGKAGVSAADILGGGLTGALALAAAGQLDVGQAGEIAATALNQFNLTGRDLPHVADLLAAGAGKAQGSVTDLSTALNYVGPVAHSMGISIEESVGILAEFASAGLVGEQGGTAFRGMLSSLLSPSELASKTMKELGINLYDASGKFIGMQATADVLHDKLGGLDEATRNQALGQIFGNAQLAAATVLYQGGGAAVADWTAKVNDQGFATEQAARLMDNLAGDVEKFSGSVETAFIQAGSGGNNALRTIVQAGTGVVNMLGQIPGPVTLVGAALGALALVGPKAFLMFRQYKSDLDTAGLSLERISERAPRVGSALSAAATGAKLLGAAFVGATIASRLFDDNVEGLHLEQLQRDLTSSYNAVKVLDQTFAASAGSSGLYTSKVTDLGSALHFALEPGFLDSADNSIRSVFEAFGGENSSDVKVASDRLKDVDATLAQLVSSGNGSQAANIMGQIENEARKQGITVDELKAKFPQYAEALAGITNASGPAAGATKDLAGAQQDAAKSAQDAAAANDALLKSLTDYSNLVLGARDSARQYEAAVDAANKALKDNGVTLDITTEKGRANQAALDGIASSTLGMVTHTFEARDANTSLAAAVDTARGQVDKGRDAFIDMAHKMGLGKTEAAALADQLGLTQGNVSRLSQTIQNVPDKTAKVDVDATPAQRHLDQQQARMDQYGNQRPPTPSLDANPAPAMAKIEGAQRKMAAYDATHPQPPISVTDLASGPIGNIQHMIAGVQGKSVSIVVDHIDRYIQQGSPSVQAGIRHAGGGLIYGPGTSTSDSIDAKLSRGEFVVNAAATALNLPLLWSINTQGAARRFAEGGHVTMGSSPSAGGADQRPTLLFQFGNIIAADPQAAVREVRVQWHDALAAAGLAP